MEFRQLEAFAAVAEQKSFSKAADYLFISQSTVSSHIKNLENELGRKLFQRTTKTLRLTPEGETFLQYALRIIDTKEAAVSAVKGSGETLLHIGASTIPSGYLLPRVLSGFRRSHPSVYFDIRQGDSQEIEERILDGTIDLGLIGEAHPSSQCVSIPFCADRLVLVTPATDSYLELKKTAPDSRRLLEEPIIVREAGSGTKKAADRYLEEQGIHRQQLNVVAQINDLESIKQMIVAGIGVSILSHFSVSDLEARGQVIVYPIETAIKRQFYISYRKARRLSPALRAFTDYAQKLYADKTRLPASVALDR